MPAVAIDRRYLLMVGAGATIAAAIRPGTACAAVDPAVVAPIQGLYDSLLRIMRAGTRTPFSQRFDMLAPAVDRALDLATILQVSVGPMWNSLSADQHAALFAAFRRYSISSYVSSFNTFTGQRFVIEPDVRSGGANQIILQTKIIPASGETHELDYVMRQTGPNWKAVDVLADGAISRVATQRSDFRSFLMHGGGDALLASLQRKAADLASG
ncbi:ABC transporter substrate-binding protein [Limobrevibacterium gyesilva]|uniref:ABC transporter substrate-binding protein n=1 Tax=Limobrevibacterium gyesilva TaxID=2991712 RepID=A0AA41YP32_9PROT|nr:ABC transporter substrate-binding protein [Limobrevibacterium gyesilva]MCW3476096.1 ABC transporter substrate-binding protein [Limobrevibacterium gyesilva]